MTTQTQDAVVSHRIGEDGLVDIRVHDGRVTIRAVEGALATVRATDGESLAGIEVEPGDGSLSIRTRRGPDFLAFGPDFRGFGRHDRDRGRKRSRGRAKELLLEIPAGTTVVVEGASADVDVRGMRGEQRYRSASGDLVLHEVRGSLTIEAVSGDVEIGADGPARIVARSVSGDLRLRAGSMSELRATTTSGDLDITGRFDGAGPYAIETISGDATVAPIGGGLRIEPSTITGDVDSDLPSRREEGEGRRALLVGEGGPTVTFRSTSGDLRVVAVTSEEKAIRTTSPVGPPPLPAVSTAPPTSLARPTGDDYARLEVLRALERGDLDVAEAGRRLEAIEDGEALGAETSEVLEEHRRA